jgi:hypothetical protein
MDVDHELVEMRAAFAFDLRDFEKQVHQHRLTAPDATPDIQPARRIRLFAQKPPDRAAAWRDGFQFCLDLCQCDRRRCLVGVGLQFARRHKRGIALGDGMAAHLFVGFLMVPEKAATRVSP